MGPKVRRTGVVSRSVCSGATCLGLQLPFADVWQHVVLDVHDLPNISASAILVSLCLDRAPLELHHHHDVRHDHVHCLYSLDQTVECCKPSHGAEFKTLRRLFSAAAIGDGSQPFALGGGRTASGERRGDALFGRLSIKSQHG
eukprot:4722647-Amphidinium_carterae.1